MSQVYRILAEALQDRADQHERGTRLAVELRTYDTVGDEGAFVSGVLPFDVSFIEVPSVSYGTQLLRPVSVAELPFCSGGVHGWQKDPHTEAFTGARVWVRMLSAPSATRLDAVPKPVIPIRHHFTFTGLARWDSKALAEAMDRGVSVRRPLFGQ